MSEVYATALSLLAIGMITVFVVLALVVITGKILIRTVNRFFPAPELVVTDSLSNAKIAAITSAVEIVTRGKGTIEEIKKIN